MLSGHRGSRGAGEEEPVMELAAEEVEKQAMTYS